MYMLISLPSVKTVLIAIVKCELELPHRQLMLKVIRISISMISVLVLAHKYSGENCDADLCM